MLKQAFAAATSLTLAFTAVAGSAEAAVMDGSISFSGAATFGSTAINPLSDSLTFDTFKIDTTNGNFDGIGISSISKLLLSFVNAIDGVNDTNGTSGLYNYEGTTAFVTFDNGTTFNLDPGTLTRSRVKAGPLTTISGSSVLRGTFVNASGESEGLGSLNATYSSNSSKPKQGSSSYSSSVTATPVPEPLTILGTLTAAGLGLGLKKKFEQEEA